MEADSMKVPREFIDLTNRFYQGSLRDAATEQEWVRNAARYLKPDERRVIRDFLDKLLNGGYDEGELQNIWNNSRSDYYLTGKSGARDLLRLIRDEIWIDGLMR
jgi:hypothetical protein